MTDRRSFVAWLGTLAAALQRPRAAAAPPEPPGPTLRALPTALYRQPDGRNNLIRITVTGLDAPAARARVTDRRGTLVGTAGLLPEDAGPRLAGETGRGVLGQESPPPAHGAALAGDERLGAE